MKPAAHIHAVIELIDAVLANPQIPADQILHKYCRTRRYMGSSDRRTITEQFYDVLRQWPLLDYLSPHISGRQAMLVYLHCVQKKTDIQTLFNGHDFSPPILTSDEKFFLNTLIPEKAPMATTVGAPLWLWPELCAWNDGEKGEEEARKLCEAMQHQAPFDIRANPLKTNREKLQQQFHQQKLFCTPTPYSPLGLRFNKRIDLAHNALFREGLAEVQDEGSQLVALLCDAKPGMRVMDFCAGAGGKSLLLAAAMENKGTLVLGDIHPWRLAKAQERLKRAGVHNHRSQTLPDNTWLKRQTGTFDRVLVDAPCSGTGTWRRNPDLKVKFTQKDLGNLVQEQNSILKTAALLVKPGGFLIYATCSVLRRENHQQVETFLEAHPGFSLVDAALLWAENIKTPWPFSEKMLQLFPHQHGTDGFFVACLKKE